jgi:hypothetical protein
MRAQTFPARAARATSAPTLRSRAFFRWQAKRRSLDALTGQAGTLVRASVSTALDSNGDTITVPYGRPRWEWRDWSGSGDADTIGLRMTTDDLTWPVAFLPAAMTVMVEGCELGTLADSGALVYLGNDGQTGARYLIESSGTYYRATLNDGASTNTVTLATAAPAEGQVFRAVGQLQVSDDGTEIRHRLLLDVLRTPGVIETDWSAWLAMPAAWGSGYKLRVNRKGSAGTQGDTWLRQVALEPSILTPQEMTERL